MAGQILGSDSDKASAHAQSSESGHHCSAGFADGTADHQNVPKLALVGVWQARSRNGLCVPAAKHVLPHVSGGSH